MIKFLSNRPDEPLATQLGFIPALRHLSNRHLLQLFRLLESILHSTMTPSSNLDQDSILKLTTFKVDYVLT